MTCASGLSMITSKQIFAASWPWSLLGLHFLALPRNLIRRCPSCSPFRITAKTGSGDSLTAMMSSLSPRSMRRPMAFTKGERWFGSARQATANGWEPSGFGFPLR